MSKQVHLWQLSATDLYQGFQQGLFTPVDALESCLQRMASLNDTLNAVIHTDLDGAREAARESTQRWADGNPMSRLDGVPITIKDNIHVKGMPTVWGSKLFRHHIPEKDELPVQKMREAGAVIIGKTNVPEFTLHGYTDNAVFGPTFNPWNTALTPGGSSGGAASATAAGFAPIALGTDGGGSIRRPSSHTGLVGLKPSIGRVPRANSLPVILNNYEVIGPMTRTVADLELVMDVIGLEDAADPRSFPYHEQPYQPMASHAPLKILYIKTFSGQPVDPQIAASVEKAANALEALGHMVDWTDHFPLVERINNDVWPVVTSTGLTWLLQNHPDWKQQIAPALQSIAEQGATYSALDYIQALDTVAAVKTELRTLFLDYDLLMTPTAAALPWPATDLYPDIINETAVGPRGHAFFTGFVNATGLPAISVPCTPASNRLPIGFQLIGWEGDDALLCCIARSYEAKHPWLQLWADNSSGEGEPI